MNQTGIIWSERNRKISIKQQGSGNSFYGKKHTEESKQKIREHTLKQNAERDYANTEFKKLKKQMRLKGFDWCRLCQEFYLSANVHMGLCRHHQNEKYRQAYSKNPDKIRLRIYARKRGLYPIPVAFKEFLFEKFSGNCAYCGKPATTLDHFFPVNKGGNSTPDNLLPCCASCNPKKSDKHPSEWNFELTENIIDIILPTLTNSGKIHHILN